MYVLEPTSLQALFDCFLPFQANAGKHQIRQGPHPSIRCHTADILQVKKKVKWSRYRPGVAQRVGRGIALFFNDSGTRRVWVVSSTPRPHFTPRKDTVPILQEAGWAPGLVRTGGIARPHRESIPDHPASGQSLYRLSHPAHDAFQVIIKKS